MLLSHGPAPWGTEPTARAALGLALTHARHGGRVLEHIPGSHAWQGTQQLHPSLSFGPSGLAGLCPGLCAPRCQLPGASPAALEPCPALAAAPAAPSHLPCAA